MKAIFVLLGIMPFTAAFTAPTTFVAGRRTTAVYGLGDRFKNLIGRKEVDVSAAVLDKEEVVDGINVEGALEIAESMNVEDAVEIPKEEEKSESAQMMQKVKDAGVAGVISYALWELGFWTISLPICIFGYYEVTGHWPDLNNPEDVKKVGAEAFAFVNFARFAVPLRIGLALSTTPWIQTNIVDKYIRKEGEEEPAQEENGGE